MKKIAIILGLLASFCAYAVTDRTDEQKFMLQNLLQNGGAELGTNLWTASGGTLTTTATAANVGFGKRALSWNSNGAAQTLTYTAQAIPAGMYGKNGTFFCSIQTPTGTATHTLSVTDGTNTLNSLTVTSATTYTKTGSTFVIPSSGNLVIKLTSVNADEPLIYIDGCYLGLADGTYLTNVGQSTLYGTLTYAQASNCNWSRTSTGSDSFGAFAADTDCSTPTVTGSVSAPGTKIPGIVLNNLPPGDYVVTATAPIQKVSTTDTQVGLRLSDGTTNSQPATWYSIAENGSISPATIVGRFQYTTAQSSVTIQIQGITLNTSATIQIPNSNGAAGVEFQVVRYPLSSETAYNINMVPSFGGARIAIDSGHVFSTTSASYVKATDSDVVSGDKTHRGKGEITATAGDFGVKISNLVPGAYLVMASGDFQGVYASTDTVCAYGLSDDGGSTVSDSTFVRAGADGVNNQSFISSVFNYTAQQSSKEFTVYLKRSSGGGTCYLANNSSLFEISVIPLSQSITNPVILNQVSTNNSGGVKINGAKVYCANSGASITSQSGDWITTNTGSGGTAGRCTLTLKTGEFSGSPWCVCTADVSGGDRTCAVNVTSATSVALYLDASGTPTNLDAQIQCMYNK